MVGKRLDKDGRRIWPWPRNEQYTVREDGVIFGPRGPALIMSLRNERLSVGMRLSGLGSVKTYEVAVIVCETFHGPKPDPAMHAAHLDGDHRNNAATNLAWKTARDNAVDKLRHGTQPIGPDGRAFLAEEHVREIRRKREEGQRAVDLAAEYGVSTRTITRIANGISWSTL